MVAPLPTPSLAWAAGESAPRPAPERTPEPHRAPHLRLVPTPAPIDPVLRQRDPETIRRLFTPIARLSETYFRAEVEGVEHLTAGRSMLVSTHNGGCVMPDMQALMVAFWRRFGLETPGYGLTHAIVLRMPWIGKLSMKLGAIAASHENGSKVLRAGHPLLVCPGGDEDALKPFSARHQIVFGRRRGFIRLAIEQQVPIIPIISVGAHEIFFILNDGRRLAQSSWVARRLRIKSVPMSLSFPFGLTPAGLLSVPLPSKVRVRVLPRIELGEKPSAAKDAAVVERCFEHVRSTMQRSLDQLAAERAHVVLG
jgi:1-acyl-sn-glycerol-3-phosphate acyltransferase